MNESDKRPPIWLGGLVALAGIAGVLVAGLYWPVEDPAIGRKMSCFWAIRAVVPLSAMVALCGIQAVASTTQAAARAAAWLAIGAAALQVMTIHWIIPVMPHNLLHQRVHDLMSIGVIIVCLLGLFVMAPAQDINAALDAAAEGDEAVEAEPEAAPEEPEAGADEAPDAADSAAGERES